MSDTIPAPADVPRYWDCEACGMRNAGRYHRRDGWLPPPDACRRCGGKRPPVSRELPPVKITFCTKCGCNYTGDCPVHA